jgi:hypothetical protein
MYIIAIGWLYVVVLMAATEPNLVAGAMTLISYGLIPLALLLWLFGTPHRRRLQRQKARQNEAIETEK